MIRQSREEKNNWIDLKEIIIFDDEIYQKLNKRLLRDADGLILNIKIFQYSIEEKNQQTWNLDTTHINLFKKNL